MIMGLNEAIGRRLGRGERGAATLETVGMYVVAAMLAAAVVLVVVGSSPVVGDTFRQAVCTITTLGQGECGSSVTSAADHQPTAPCVVSADGHTGAIEATFIVTVGASERFLVERLNNGQFRVTRGTGGKVGVGVGVGFDVSATWDEKKYGAAAAAGANVAATFSDGEAYYANTKDEALGLIAAHAEDVAEDTIFGNSGIRRRIVDGAKGLVHLGHDFPPVAETYVEGGASADMSAQLTGLAASAGAEGSAQAVLGTRQGADGTSTTYYQVSADLNLGAGIWKGNEQTGEATYGKAAFERKVGLVMEVERDAKGVITAVRAKSAESGNTEATAAESADSGPGKNEYSTETVVELPIHSATDQAIAQRYLNALGMGPIGGFKDIPQGVQNDRPIQSPLDALGASKEFGQAAALRGHVTQQTFDDSKSGKSGVNFDAKYLAKIGGGATVDAVNRKSTGATYYDGRTMVPWIGCGGK